MSEEPSAEATDRPPQPTVRETPSLDAPRTVGVVGAGTMGAGIAQVALEAGWEVRLFDIDRRAVDRARGRIWDGLLRRAAKRRADAHDPGRWADAQLGRLTSVSEVSDVVTPATGLVIEAALEEIGAKRDLFAVLDGSAPPETILATNTSALSVGRIAEATYRPERVIGLHFFNPAPILALVEVVSTRLTAPAVAGRATEIVRSFGKTPIQCTDSPGFVVNRVNRAFTLEPLRLVQAGVGSIEEVDAALVDAGFPMGPFRLMDLVGVDVNLATARSLFEAFDGAPRFRPSPLQEDRVRTGRLGRKTGEGFYRYDDAGRVLGISPSVAEVIDAHRVRLPAPQPFEAEEVAERTILAIVNEAYRALGEGVATTDDIDLALQLGANHPFGPFEWARRVGLAEVALTLDRLAEEDSDMFRPALALLREAAA